MRRTKSGFFTKILSALVISISSLCFISCGDLLNILVPVLFGQISDFTATPGNGYVSLSWSNGYYSGYLYLETKETNTNTIKTENCDWMEPDAQGFLPTGCYVDGLTNGTSYTFTLTLYEKKDESSTVISYATAKATPSQNAGGGSGGGGSGSGTSVTKDVATDGYFFELDGGVSSVTINGAAGKMITYANVNTGTSNVIKSSAVRRYVSGLRAADTGIQAVASNVPESVDANADVIRHFVPPTSVNVIANPSRAATNGDTFDKSDPQIGQTRSIYVDADSDLSTFRQERMTLYAIGYKPGSDNDIACLVWANANDVEASEMANSSKTKIGLGVIQDIALKFVQHYQFEEELFGGTSDQLITKYGSKISMKDNGPTKDWVNIVLYDIGRDGTAGTCGVVGYFFSKDYYKSESYPSSDARSITNVGKYFYIDIPFCNYDSSRNTYKTNNDEVSGTVISTLFHEYQHMIDFNTKEMRYDLDTDDCVWYNEMLSMLCEDIMGEQLELADEDRVATGRIKNFNAYYYYSGTAQYLKTNSWISYGTAYAFGAWLVRNFGGWRLIQKMSTNNAVGTESIVQAVNTVNSTAVTWDWLFKEYIKACGFRPAFEANHHQYPQYSLNCVPGEKYTTNIYGSNDSVALYAKVGYDDNWVSSTVSNTLNGTLKGINLWSYSYRNKSTYGPALLSSNTSVDVQPTGFVFRNIGRVTTNEPVTLRFTTSSNENEKLYIFVQDYETGSDGTAEPEQN
ncbi:MAG: hypothetical protein J6Y60_00415 [Treponema sp.]|nr:hypothetical protein [Treponema sp.]